MAVAGGCRCGEVRYELAVSQLPAVYCCHCRYCQTSSGSSFSEQALMMTDAIIAAGPVITYALSREDSATSTQYLCGTCHTRLWNVNSKYPMLAALRAGTLDESEHLSPEMHIWTKRKQPWIVIDPAIASFAENAPPADFMALIAR